MDALTSVYAVSVLPKRPSKAAPSVLSGSNPLNLQLEADGFPCTSISGQLDNDQRDAVIREFRTGITKILIATDVLARGFDVQQVLLWFRCAVVYKWPCMAANHNLPSSHKQFASVTVIVHECITGM